MVVQMNQYGSALCTRQSGRRAYDDFGQMVLDADDVIVFDFSGVDTVTNSFADETFGRLAYVAGMAFLRSHTTFKKVKRLDALTIRRAMETRAAEALVRS